MRLTQQTDYALRLLLHLAGMTTPSTSIARVAEAQGISRAHLMKIANLLSRAGLIAATRGRGGGVRLALSPEAIRLGDVLRITEPGCALVDCTYCQLLTRCRLPRLLGEARQAFQAVLDRYTLADALAERTPVSI